LLYALRYSIGIPQQDVFRFIDHHITPEELNDKERSYLKRRVANIARQDAMDQINVMYRRAIVVARDVLTADHPLIKDAEAIMAPWVEKAATLRLPLNQVIRREIRSGLELMEQEYKKKIPEADYQFIRNNLLDFVEYRRGSADVSYDEALWQEIKNRLNKTGKRELRRFANHLGEMETVLHPGMTMTAGV
jgi:hypothetical protein